MLSKAVRSGATPGSTVWNATDTSTPGRIYAEVKTSP
jgi:hypothetical protein